jgi:hypothetical protein
MNARRLEAEPLRDAMLAVSGQLDRTTGGSMLDTNLTLNVDAPMNTTPSESRRRSVYLPVVRNNLGDLFQVFDFPDPHVVAGRRHSTTAPTQALFMMNSPFVLEQAKAFAASLLADAAANDASRIEAAYVRALGRPPGRAEAERALLFLNQRDAAGSENQSSAWRDFCHALLASAEFRFVN